MVEQEDDVQTGQGGSSGRGDPVEPALRAGVEKHARRATQRRSLPQYRVMLHHDDMSTMSFAIRTLTCLTPLNRMRATVIVLHAHYHHVALILITHKERAELYQAQFRAKGLKVTIEPDS